MNGIKIDANLGPLKALIKDLRTNYYTDVGLIGDKAKTPHPESTLTVAGIGAVHEFGVPDRNIPARSLILFPIQHTAKRITSDGQKALKKALESGKKLRSVFVELGRSAEQSIQEAFETGGFGTWKPLKEETIIRKGSDSILIVTGLLRKSVTSQVGPSSSAGNAE